MALADIASGIEVTTEQREQSIAVVDGTDTSLATRLAAFEDELPCSAVRAASTIETRLCEGSSITESARSSAVAPMTAAKVLYRVGEPIAAIDRLDSTELERWLDGDCSRTDAIERTDAGLAQFALATYVATHDPISDARAVVADWLAGQSPFG